MNDVKMEEVAKERMKGMVEDVGTGSKDPKKEQLKGEK